MVSRNEYFLWSCYSMIFLLPVWKELILTEAPLLSLLCHGSNFSALIGCPKNTPKRFDSLPDFWRWFQCRRLLSVGAFRVKKNKWGPLKMRWLPNGIFNFPAVSQSEQFGSFQRAIIYVLYTKYWFNCININKYLSLKDSFKKCYLFNLLTSLLLQADFVEA